MNNEWQPPRPPQHVHIPPARTSQVLAIMLPLAMATAAAGAVAVIAALDGRWLLAAAFVVLSGGIAIGGTDVR